ncbi:MAG: GNAT family N-acetyltransferase [Saprospiraceae bacterium]
MANTPNDDLQLSRELSVLCAQSGAPLCLQPWWWDVLRPPGASVRYALARDGGGRILGMWPQLERNLLGWRHLSQPRLNAYAGPWLFWPPEYASATPRKRLDFYEKTCAALVAQIPRRMTFFRQNLHPEIVHWGPMYRAGFREALRYTYFLQPAKDPQALWKTMRPELRNELRHAERMVCVSMEDAPELAYDLHAQVWLAQGKRSPYDRQAFLRLHGELRARAHARCFLARSPHAPTPLAALYCCADARRASILLIGRDHSALRRVPAVSLLIWNVIQQCAAEGLSLDFEGSMLPGVERFFRKFGGALRPYHRVWRMG